MNSSDFQHYLEQLPGVTCSNNFGYILFFYGKEQMTPFVSIAESDNEFDDVSKLNRDGVFRLNLGVSAETFKRLFPIAPTQIDYSRLNVFIPHPHYAPQNFICILNPSGPELDQTMSLIAEAYEIAKRRFERKSQG